MNTSWMGLSHESLVPAGSDHQLHLQVLPDFNAMQQAACADGVNVDLVSTYRSFEKQLSIWNRKWHGQLPILDLHGQPTAIDTLTDEQKMHAILTWSALPGTSRHHWGTDLDVYDRQAVHERGMRFNLVDAEYRAGGPCAGLAAWLSEHAEDFGFFRPYLEYRGGVACELWHLSHRITARAYEKSRNCEQLAAVLAEADLAGKHTVLAHIESVYRRYVLNQGRSL
ncbi:M15 family metallopeptidase [Salinimonas marina]|uniref:M15 family metallopeptidase n=1 Tax=Salinimonas marina TaxID=2785918 RepID=A0A7S9DVI9_9ALTE|nr:M15 family metallopeptidase [Salinimonas marina]QPG04622.1 M15 family metallopeptidase [Salinimonas marina]